VSNKQNIAYILNKNVCYIAQLIFFIVTVGIWYR